MDRSGSRILKFALACCFALVACTPFDGPWEGKSPRHSEAPLYLPPETLVYASLVDVATLFQHSMSSQGWTLLTGTGLEAELKNSLQKSRAESDFPGATEELKAIFTGPISFALLDFSTEAQPKEFPARVLIVADLAEAGGAKRLQDLIDQKLEPDLLKRKQGKLERVTTGPIPYTRVYSPDLGRVEGVFAIQEGRLLVASAEKDLALFAGKPASSLARHPGFAQAQAEMDAADLAVYANLPALIGKIPVPPQSEKSWEKLGLRQLRSAFYTATATREGYVERLRVGYESGGGAPWTRLVDLGSGASIRSLTHTPGSSTFAFGLQLGPISKFYETMLSFARETDPEGVEKFRAELASSGEKAGFDVENELLPLLSGEFSLSFKLPSISGMLLDNPITALGYLSDAYLSFFIGVTDEAKAQAQLSKLLTKGEVTAVGESYQGTDYYLMTSKAPLPVIPAYTLADGLLGFHLNAGTAKASIDAWKSGKGLLQDPDYQYASQPFASGSTSMLSYIRLGEVVPVILRLIQHQAEKDAGSSPTEEQAKQIRLLGEAAAATAKLHGAFARGGSEPGMLVRENYAPLPMGGLMLTSTGVGIVSAIAIPAFAMGKAATEEAERITVYFKGVEAAQAAYQAEHDAYATSFEALVESGFPSAAPPEGIGYEFHMEATPTSFALSARPTSYSPGARSYYLDETGNLLGGDNGGQWGDASLAPIP